MGYYHDNAYDLQISKDTINNRLWSTAFANPNSWFGACNVANGGNDFTYTWQRKFGGQAWGFCGKSNYKNINEGAGLIIKGSRKLNGFSYYGSKNYPVPGDTTLTNGRKPFIQYYN